MAPHLHEPALLLYQPGARARQGMQTAGSQERFDRTIRIELPEFVDSDALQLRAGAFPRGGPVPSLGDLFRRPSGKRVAILRHDCNLTVSVPDTRLGSYSSSVRPLRYPPRSSGNHAIANPTHAVPHSVPTNTSDGYATSTGDALIVEATAPCLYISI